MVIFHSYVKLPEGNLPKDLYLWSAMHALCVIFRSDRTWPILAPDVGLEIAESSSSPETVERCAFDFLTSCVNLCDVVYVDVSFLLCTFLSFRHCMVNAAEGHIGECTWRISVETQMHDWNIYWNHRERSVQPFSQRRSAGSWLHHRHAAMAMRWRWETIF